MSKYTTQVRYICETAAGLTESVGYNTIDSIVLKAYTSIFTSFPIFDENYREGLCCKILKHFYFREIAAETVGLWKFWINQKMNEIMPLYNQFYSSELLEFNPLYNTIMTTNKLSKNDKTGNDSSSSSSSTNTKDTQTSESTAINKYSDTPQGSLTDLINDKYLTNASYDSTTGTQQNVVDMTGSVLYNNDRTEKDSYTEESAIKGYSGKSAQELLVEYRNTFLNVDMMICDELEECFMQIWDSAI